MTAVRSSAWLWKEGAGYYTEGVVQLLREPMLPDPKHLRDRRLIHLFDGPAGLREGDSVLEIGCGRSRWLPFLALRRKAGVSGIDVEPFALDLAQANLVGAGAAGRLYCRDAFDLEENADLCEQFDLVYSMGVLEHFDDLEARLRILARFLRRGGRILTVVPNLQGVNWMLQRLADRDTLEMHVIHDQARLRAAHEAADFETIAAGYAGFHDGFLSCAAATHGSWRRGTHALLCRTTNLVGEAWTRLLGDGAAPESKWTSPHVYYVGRRPGLA